MNITDYIWLFDSRTILPKPFTHRDSSDEDEPTNDNWVEMLISDSSYSSESDEESEYQKINILTISFKMLTISKSFIVALSPYGDRYKEEIIKCF